MNKKKDVLRFTTVAILASLLVSCEAWGPRDNPADRSAENYQGFETVDSPSAVEPAEQDAGIVAFVPTLISSKVVDAQAYQFQIAATPDFSSPLYTSPESASNEFLPTTCSGLSASTTYYWRVRVKKGEVWTDYTTSVATFSLSAPETGNVAPANTSTTSDTTPLLDWNDVTGASGYELQYASTSGAVGGVDGDRCNELAVPVSECARHRRYGMLADSRKEREQRVGGLVGDLELRRKRYYCC
jgi:opacity protein-like surface antigen